jgi:hypothetical protein
MAQQPLQRFDSDTAGAVPQLGECAGSERNLGQGRQSLVNEALTPTQSGTLVACQASSLRMNTSIARRSPISERA